ncbi:MAG: dethiobiotin synthase [Candidatus Hydrogenedentes bacterium]|nr:dethiobiotin synthase [Candidatus Hydrogenedentota bacterium]
MKGRGVFVTGTDTGVGKTVVTATLLRQLRATGIDAVPMKPVQTGAEWADDGWHAPDLDFILEAIGYTPSPEERRRMVPYLYEHACSPHLAAELGPRLECGGGIASLLRRASISEDSLFAMTEGAEDSVTSHQSSKPETRNPEPAPILHAARALLQHHDFIVAEGAGGILVPLTRELSTLNLMAALGWPVVIVARLGLGTINHSLLTINAVRNAGLDVAGIAFNAVEPHGEGYIEEDNPKTVCAIANVPLLGVVPHLGDIRPDNANVWARDLDLGRSPFGVRLR